MEELTDNFYQLKVSAFSKLKQVTPFVHEVTIGPESLNLKKKTMTIITEKDRSEDVKKMIVMKKPSLDTSSVIYQKILTKIELDRQASVQEAINSRRQKILDFSIKQANERKQKWLEKQQHLFLQVQEQEKEILTTLKIIESENKERDEKLQQHYRDLAEIRKKNERDTFHQQKILENIKRDQNQCQDIYKDTLTLLTTCMTKPELKDIPSAVSPDLKQIPSKINEIVSKCMSGQFSEIEEKASSDLLQLTTSIHNCTLDLIKQASKHRNFARAKRGEERQKPKNPNQSVEIKQFVGASSLKLFSELENFLQSYESDYSKLQNDDKLKQFKFDCKKAINIPVNAISAVNSNHVLDKYNKLRNLLLGKPVNVGNTSISAGEHQQGIKFCTNLLAKKFVLQGDLMISSNLEAAFCYASVIISLWNEFPDFGKLLLANFYKQCPYLIPFYPPRTVDQSDEEYYVSLGYLYVNGVVETQDKFLKRMTGIMRLYSSIIVSNPKRDQNQQNPHGIMEGWRWLAAFLNLEPYSQISATMLHVFLENVGFRMESVYRKQFTKLMLYVYETYLPQLKKIDTGGPVTRLEVMLQEYKTKKRFGTPAGLLPKDFW